MWIVPEHKMLSAFVPATSGLKMGCDELAWIFAQSVTSRSKRMCKLYWLKKLKKGGWILRLSGQILRPSMHQDFEEKWTESLADIPVNRSAQREKGSEKKTPGTSGSKYENTSTQLELDGFSQKMSSGTYRLDSPRSSAIWKKMVTEWKREYSARKKLALRTREKEYLSWATPNTIDYLEPRSDEGVKKIATGARKGRKRPNNLREQVDERTCRIYQEQNWPTPRAGNPGSRKPGTGGKVLAEEVKKSSSQQDQTKTNTNGNRPGRLNPDWVEALMGLTIGSTDLGSWGTEYVFPQQN